MWERPVRGNDQLVVDGRRGLRFLVSALRSRKARLDLLAGVGDR